MGRLPMRQLMPFHRLPSSAALTSASELDFDQTRRNPGISMAMRAGVASYALLACMSGAGAAAPRAVGAGSNLPLTSRSVALDRLKAMRRTALMAPSDARAAPSAELAEDIEYHGQLSGPQRRLRAALTAPPDANIAPNEPAQEEDIEYPGPLSGPQRLLRAATFWSSALPVVFSYLQLQARFNLRERILNRCLSTEECEVEWNDAHTEGAATLKEVINDLKGFYVKTGQIIASRVDLFPRQYTDALSGLTDYLDPMPASLVRRVIAQELLTGDETFEEVFAWFDDAPLGAASIAQVHHARLTPKYGGAEVAVKVQRPAIEPKLLGDIANLKVASARAPAAQPASCARMPAQLSPHPTPRTPRARASRRGRRSRKACARSRPSRWTTTWSSPSSKRSWPTSSILSRRRPRWSASPTRSSARPTASRARRPCGSRGRSRRSSRAAASSWSTWTACRSRAPRRRWSGAVSTRTAPRPPSLRASCCAR